MNKKVVVGGVAVVLVLWSAGAASAEPAGSLPFANCTEAERAGQRDIPRASPFYAAALDRDRDGFACDSEDRGAAVPAGADDTSLGGADGAAAGRGEEHAGEEGWHEHEDGSWGPDGDDDRSPEGAGAHHGEDATTGDDATTGSDRDDDATTAGHDEDGDHDTAADAHEDWDDEQVDVVPEGGAPTGDGSGAGDGTAWWLGGGLLAALTGVGLVLRRRSSAATSR